MIDKSDIIHIHNGHVIFPEKTVIMFNLFKGKNKKVVLSLHNVDVCEKSRDIVNLPFDAYITYSSFMQENVKNLFGIFSKILPMYIGIDYPRKETIVERGYTRILQPTRFSKWKGSNLSLECIVDLLNEGQDIEFVHGGCSNLLYGNLKIPENTKRWIKKNKIKLKDYSFDEIGNEIRFADIILHPTTGVMEYGEPFSLTCLESMLLKKPIIASASGFVPNLLEGYSRKQIVKVGDKKDLFNSIKKWLVEPIPKLSEKDIKLIEKWRRYTESSPRLHIKFYQKIMNTL